LSRGWFIVFAKAPRPGLVKTRLSPPLSLDQCADFYEQMLSDVLEASARFAAEFDLEPVLAFHPPDAASELIHRAPPGFRLQAQRGTGLGERMANAFAEGAAAGAEWVLLRGSDSPGLGFDQVGTAVSRLKAGDDLVLTPDEGGGYSMIGLRKPCRELFDVQMSAQDMLQRTVETANRLGLGSTLTSPAFDVDRVADLAAVDSLAVEESSDLCPRTVEAIEALRSDGVL
jgi:rSAM/selenodomain-associated transferase 1